MSAHDLPVNPDFINHVLKTNCAQCNDRAGVNRHNLANEDPKKLQAVRNNIVRHHGKDPMVPGVYGTKSQVAKATKAKKHAALNPTLFDM